MRHFSASYKCDLMKIKLLLIFDCPLSRLQCGAVKGDINNIKGQSFINTAAEARGASSNLGLFGGKSKVMNKSLIQYTA